MINTLLSDLMRLSGKRNGAPLYAVSLSERALLPVAEPMKVFLKGFEDFYAAHDRKGDNPLSYHKLYGLFRIVLRYVLFDEIT